MANLQQEPELGEMGEIALALFHHLKDPGARDEAGNPVSSVEQQRQVLIRIKEIFGLHGDHQVVPRTPYNSGQAAGPPDAATSAVADVAEPSREEPEKAVAPAPNPYPHINAAQWAAREPVRQLLENILTHQADHCEMQRRELLKESVAGPSPFELAAEFSPSPAQALLVRRAQDANMREVRRLTNLLFKIKRRERKIAAKGTNKDVLRCHDVTDNEEA
jgi:hypothetical protein